MKISNPVLRIRNFFLLGQTDTNPGVVTILAGFTTVLTTVAITLQVGDLVMLAYSISATKGVTAGNSVVRLDHIGGTGTALINNGIPTESRLLNVPVGNLWSDARHFFARCTIAGTVQYRLTCASGGSDSTVAIDGGQITQVIFR